MPEENDKALAALNLILDSMTNKRVMQVKSFGLWEEVKWDAKNQVFRGKREPAGFSLKSVLSMQFREVYVPFKPVEGDVYYYYFTNSEGEVIYGNRRNEMTGYDALNFASRNCFRSEIECLEHPEIKQMLEYVLKDLADYEPQSGEDRKLRDVIGSSEGMRL